jgi:hypothetical protein
MAATPEALNLALGRRARWSFLASVEVVMVHD